MKVISIIALKGGVGKTTTSVNLAYELGRRGYRVLLIDADPQGNSTSFYKIDTNATTTGDLICGNCSCYADAVQGANYDNVSVIPADMSLFGIDLNALMGERTGSLRCISDVCAAIAEDDSYDVVLVDCPPGFTAASVAAIAASDLLIVPTPMDVWAWDGYLNLFAQIQALEGRLPKVPRLRLLQTMREKRDKLQDAICEKIVGNHVNMFDTVIHRSKPVGAAALMGQPVAVYSANSLAAKDYNSLAKELIRRELPKKGGAQHE